MSRYPLSLGAAFLAGVLAGLIAMGSWGFSRGSGSQQTPERLAESGEAAPMTDSPEAAAQDDSEGTALTAVSSEMPAGGSAAETETETDAEAEGVNWEARLLMISSGWERTQDELARLHGRVLVLEQRLAVRDTANEPERPERPSAANDRRLILVKAGVAKDLAADFVWREDQYELDRLELRDMAIREGWFGDERYRDDVGRLEGRRPDLRTEVDDDVYDRYFFAAGEDNRVRVSSAIPSSPAEAAGVGPGDLIETYDGDRVFTFLGLRDATTEGERGDLVPVDVRRPDRSRVQIWLPRGPLGVRMEMARADPVA